MKKYSEKCSLDTLEQSPIERKKPRVIKIQLSERLGLSFLKVIWIFERR